MRTRPMIFAALLISACTPDEAGQAQGSAEVFTDIAGQETILATGTEPFWRVEITEGVARYSTPEDIDGKTFAVERFAGNSGLGLSGTIEGRSFDLMVTRGDCSDQMSNRTYPFTATLMLGEEQRQGCAWTDRQPFTGPENP